MKGNAQIEGTMLGYEDHGFLTCMLYLKQGGSGQGFGGWALDSRPPKNSKGNREGDRQPSKVCGFWIKRILETVGVEKWEELKGQYIRVEGEDFGIITSIGNITQEKWFFPEKEVKEFLNED